MNIFRTIALICSLGICAACGVNQNSIPQGPASSSELIKVNQLGFLPDASKVAIIPNVSAATFEMRDEHSGKVVYRGSLSEPKIWEPAGEQSFKIADFTALTTAGNYRIFVTGVAPSLPVVIAESVYEQMHAASIKAYYFNRAGFTLDKKHAGKWARAAGHADKKIKIHSLAATKERPEGAEFASPKGWYDAGDYGKYIVNSGITTYTLLASLQNHPNYYASLELNIPESGDAVPDLLDEIMWNLEWMQTMQDPNDGGVYHKLTPLGFSGAVMPENETSQRYFIQKSTAATLNFVATMATASRVLALYEAHFPGLSKQYREAALKAWAWCLQHPDVIYQQGAHTNVVTGQYGDTNLQDELAWATAELYLLTGEPSFYTIFKRVDAAEHAPNWSNVGMLPHISFINSGAKFVTPKQRAYSESVVVSVADHLLRTHAQSTYRTAMSSEDFVWGSNSVILNRAWVLLEAYSVSATSDYKVAAQGLIDFVLGKNPTDYSFVTGFGAKSPMFIHHRTSEADGVVPPIPGLVAGGPQPGQQDGCIYSSNAPAASYLDDWCSYASNEVAINWNAPLVAVIAALTHH